MSPFDAVVEQMRRAFREVLVEVGLSQPAPYPIHVGVHEAAQLMSVGTDTIYHLIRTGQLRTLQLDGVRRTLIPTEAIRELDPAHRPAEVTSLTERLVPVEDFGPEWDVPGGAA